MRRQTAWILILVMIHAILCGGAAAETAAGSGAAVFTVNNVVENNSAIGRCVVPEGYTIVSDMQICSLQQSVSYPCQAIISAGREDGPQMIYLSDRSYISGTTPDAPTQDGTYNYEFQTPMLHYMDAPEYCSYVASQVFPAMADNGIMNETDILTFPEVEEVLRYRVEQETAKGRRELTGTIGTIDDMKASIAMKAFSFQIDGENYYGFVLTATAGVWVTAHGYKNISWIMWQVPFTYMMFASEKDGDEAAFAFSLFAMNTTASDQFIKANKDMSDALWELLKERYDIRDCFDYSCRTISEATSSGDDYDEDRLTDYIFDQNDYTLRDGSHVKVSTGYDYVWEGDNGNVYASTSLFDQPGGSTQLVPNH